MENLNFCWNFTCLWKFYIFVQILNFCGKINFFLDFFFLNSFFFSKFNCTFLWIPHRKWIIFFPLFFYIRITKIFRAFTPINFKKMWMIGLGTIFRENCSKNYYENRTWPIFELKFLFYWGEFRKVSVRKSSHFIIRLVYKRVLLGKKYKKWWDLWYFRENVPENIQKCCGDWIEKSRTSMIV